MIILVLASLTLACMEQANLPTATIPVPTATKTVLASPTKTENPLPTQEVICVALRGAATVRNSNGEAVTWLPVGTPVCFVPGVNQRVILADGTNNTVLRACIFGPRKDCK